MAEVQIDAMRVADAVADHPWTHYINLTGQDFPLRSRAEILETLGDRPDASYVSWFDPLEKPLWDNARERLTQYYLEWPWLQKAIYLPGVGRRLRQLMGWHSRPFIPFYQRAWPSFFKYYGGSNHVILSRAAVRHFLNDPGAQRIIEWLRPSLHANEIVFQCVMMNSPLADTVINTHLRTVDFARLQDPHPRVWKSEDFDRLVASRGLFARKFDFGIDETIVTRLEEHIREQERVHA